MKTIPCMPFFVLCALLSSSCAVDNTSTKWGEKNIGSRAKADTASDVRGTNQTQRDEAFISKFQSAPLGKQMSRIDERGLLELLTTQEAPFVLYVSSEQCSNNYRIWSALPTYEGPWPLYILHQDPNAPEHAPATRDFLQSAGPLGTPTVYLVRAGQIIDRTSTDLPRFVARNTGSAPSLRGVEGRARTPEARRKALLFPQKPLSYRDFSGVNVSGLALSHKHLDGVDARNANFRGAKLHSINFSHADLRGANLDEAATLEDIFWGECICPDGTPSSQAYYSCMNNLSPIRVAGIPTDPDPDPVNEVHVRGNRMNEDIERLRRSASYEPAR